jgi:CBS domain-containing protein
MTVKSLSRRAADLMTSPALHIAPEASIGKAAAMMVERNVGCLPVVDRDGRLVGLLTERMLQAQLAGTRPASSIPFQQRTILELWVGHPGQLDTSSIDMDDFRRRPVKDAMDRDPVSVDGDAPVWQVAEAMLQHHVSHLPVVRHGKLAGVVARHDLVREIAEQERRRR